ncbi:hypothetical protein SAMN04488101_101157 [Pedobacter nyackensis]|uniref:Uncharacterized protein n=2 Tax=Pedobacter nyackensis TaxID=475255 RepID=A0A1W1ZYA6_9SPHI|nr:hypothetical protein SAMN04488101_101157 [Pedobacter nyackensis]
MSCTGCKKEYKYPELTLIGTWYSSSPELQFPIANTKGEGKYIQFLEYSKEDIKYLKVSYKTGEEAFEDVYIVKWIGKNEMMLIDTKDPEKKDIPFVRMK